MSVVKLTNPVDAIADSIADPLEQAAKEFKQLQDLHDTANQHLKQSGHDLEVTMGKSNAQALSSMINKQYSFADSINQRIGQIATIYHETAQMIRTAAHWLDPVLNVAFDLLQWAVDQLTADIVVRQGQSAVQAIFDDLRRQVNRAESDAGNFFGDIFHLDLGAALHDAEDEGKALLHIAGDALAMVATVEPLLCQWAEDIFQTVNRCFNQIESVILGIVDWVFGISDIIGDQAVLDDPNATPEEKAIAGTMMAVTILMDVATFIPGLDIFAAGGKLAAKGILTLLEKFGVDELAKVLADKFAQSVAANLVKDLMDGALSTAKQGLEKSLEYLAEKGLISKTLTTDTVFNFVGHLLGPDAAKTFEALSPEGKKFVENYAHYVSDMLTFDDPLLKNATADERAAFFKEQQKAWFASLTDTEKKAITDYTGNLYQDINDFSRKGILPPGMSASDFARQFIQPLDTALKDAIIPKDTVAQRVVGDNMLKFFEEGKLFQDSGYLSTSINPQHSWANSIRLFIDLPEGSTGAFVQDLSKYPNEYEVLLPRNSVMQVEHIIDLNKLGLSAADQSLLAKFPEYIVKLRYLGIGK